VCEERRIILTFGYYSFEAMWVNVSVKGIFKGRDLRMMMMIMMIFIGSLDIIM